MSTDTAPRNGPLDSRRTVALLLFLLSLGVTGRSLVSHRQLEGLGGIVDEWFLVGLNHRVYGTLGIEPGRSDVALSPGYTSFVAAIAAFREAPAWVTPGYFRLSMEIVFLGQALLLAAASAAMFLWLAPTCGPAAAAAVATILGTGPYTVILVGLLHYDILHIFLVVVGCWALQRVVSDPDARVVSCLATGLLWGAATLVRPLTLPLPLLLAASMAWLARRDARAIARVALPVLVGMAAVIAPYMVRNHAITGRWVFSAEGWMALWGSTVRVLGIHPNHYNWGQLFGDFMPTFTRVTGEREYSRHAFLTHVVQLEDAFRAEAFANIQRQPMVYAQNCLQSLAAFAFGINSVLVGTFQYLQTGPVWPSQDWFVVGHRQEFLATGARAAFSWFVALLTALASLGAVSAVRRRDASLAATAAALASIASTHTFVYMDLMYFYVKVPFLLVLAASALGRLPPRRSRLAATALAGASLLLSFAVLA